MVNCTHGQVTVCPTPVFKILDLPGLCVLRCGSHLYQDGRHLHCGHIGMMEVFAAGIDGVLLYYAGFLGMFFLWGSYLHCWKSGMIVKDVITWFGQLIGQLIAFCSS